MNQTASVAVEVVVAHAFTLSSSLASGACAGGTVGGNAAGVVRDAGGLTAVQMQQVATRMALSETAFLIGATALSCQVRFFTPSTEIDFCGHALLAAFALAGPPTVDTPMTMITAAGPVTLRRHPDGKIFMEQPLPIFSGNLDRKPISDLLRLPESAIAQSGLPVEIVSTGLPDLLVPVVDRSALAAMTPDFAALARYNELTNTVGVHAFTLEADGVSAHCRNFAPRFGINEESATGSSSGALACYLSRHHDRFGGEYLFEQGTAMGMPSRIAAKTERLGSAIRKVEVGGFVTRGPSVWLNG